jgi:cytochrome b involved in lipid metabolism
MVIEVKAPKSQTLYTLEQVSTHCTKEDAWTIIDDKIYDLTKYTKNEIHPGGEVIFSLAGGDSTDAFTGF